MEDTQQMFDDMLRWGESVGISEELIFLFSLCGNFAIACIHLGTSTERGKACQTCRFLETSLEAWKDLFESTYQREFGLYIEYSRSLRKSAGGEEAADQFLSALLKNDAIN